MRSPLHAITASVAAALALACAGARAHDTWFEPLGGDADATLTLALGTGNRFPVAESASDTRYFARSGCVGRDGRPQPLELQRYTAATTLLRAAPATTCFVQLDPFEVELQPDKIAIYFRDIRPAPAVLQARAAQAARGTPFRERYVKSARIELDPQGATQPVGTAMDVVRTAPQGPAQLGAEATFQVLRDGQPLADFPVELVNERSPIGLWFRTDDAGRVRAKLPLRGRWLLRGTDLHVSATDPDRWESRFITYAFVVR